MIAKATTADAFKLLLDGSLALARMEDSGIRVDEARLEKTTAKVARKIDRLKARLKRSEVWAAWEKEYGRKANNGSLQQFAHVLHDVMGYPCENRTPTGLPQMTKEILGRIDHPFAKQYVELGDWEDFKVKSLDGLKRELVGGYLHPNFNLHLARTYRSSSGADKSNGKQGGKDFNLQNIPVRDPVFGEPIRSCFIPRDGHVIVERDFKAIEVVVGHSYHRDPTMMEYLLNPKKDMHRDMAAACFLLHKADVSKKTRYCGKNGFVFPSFYGSWYPDIARFMWNMIDDFGLVVESTGQPLKEHLKSKGIIERGECSKERDAPPPVPGTFEHHIQKVERDFWDRRFPVYKRWKQEWHDAYLRTGGFDMLTGFHVEGVYDRNQVINSPIQGSAFHCLLMTLIVMQRKMDKAGMKAKFVGQIHDSLIADVPTEELQAFLSLGDRVVAGLRRRWPWIEVPLTIECEVAESNWFSKKEWTKQGGVYAPAA